MGTLKKDSTLTSQIDIFPPRWRPPEFDELKLTSEEQRVYAAIRFHEGREKAIRVEYIVLQTKMPDREVRGILKHLTEKHRLGVASTTRPPYGIYLIETAEELEEYCNQIHSRAMSMLTREAALKRQHLAELLGQIRLDEEER